MSEKETVLVKSQLLALTKMEKSHQTQHFTV